MIFSRQIRADHFGGIVESLEIQGTAGIEDRKGRGAQGADMEQGSNDKGLVGAVDPAAHDRVDRTEKDIAMREDRPFGIPGRPGGVHDKQGIGQGDLLTGDRFRIRTRLNDIGQGWILPDNNATVPEVICDPRQGGPHLLDPGGKVRGIDKDPGGAVPKDIDHFRCGQAAVDGRHDRPCLGACKKYLQELGGIAHQNGHPLAPDDAPALQCMGHPVHPLVELAVRKGPLALLRQEKAVRIDSRPLENPFTDIHPISPIYIFSRR